MQNTSKIYKGHNIKITSTPCKQLILYNCRVYKKYVPWTVNATFQTQIMTVVSLHQSREKSTLGWKKEDGRKGVIIINGQQ